MHQLMTQAPRVLNHSTFPKPEIGDFITLDHTLVEPVCRFYEILRLPKIDPNTIYLVWYSLRNTMRTVNDEQALHCLSYY